MTTPTQIQLVPEKTEAAGSIKDDKKVEKRIQADEMITGKGKEEEEKKEEERKTEETETTPPLMLHALNVAHNQVPLLKGSFCCSSVQTSTATKFTWQL